MNKGRVSIYIILIVIFLCIIGVGILSYSLAFLNRPIKIIKNIPSTTTTTTKKMVYTNFKMTAVGDCTIGYDDNFGYSNSFNEVIEKNGYDYIFSNVRDIFSKDDITVANLEGTFTDATVKKVKKFNFKGPKDYVNVLTGSSVEVVNLANNHTYDYNEIGYNDTIDTLNAAGVNYFGYDNYYIYEKDDIKIGFAGIFCIEDYNCTSKIDTALNDLKNLGSDYEILSFHWGIETNLKQSSIQTYLAHYAIDNGALMVLGHHPHVLQGIELYNGKYIIYSLANFAFGGNKDPRDKDTMIVVTDFNFIDKELKDIKIEVIPTSVSSVTYINDYKPTPLTGDEYDRVMKKIEKNSVGITLS